MLRLLFDRAITSSINVQGAGYEQFKQSILNILPLLVYGLPLLEEGWSVGGAKNRFTNLTGIFLVCPMQNIRRLSKLLNQIICLECVQNQTFEIEITKRESKKKALLLFKQLNILTIYIFGPAIYLV